MRIYIGNLPRTISEEEVKQEFAAFGAVDSVTLIKDKFTGELKGFGFVELPVQAEGEAAIAGLNGKEIKGRKATVNEARPMSEHHSSGGGGNRGRFNRRPGGNGGDRH